MEESQGQSPVEASIEERVAAALSPAPKAQKAPENEPPEESEEQNEEQEESGEDEEVEEAEEAEEAKDELDWDRIKDAKLEIIVQGEKAEVTLEEARLGYMRTSDYQKKTQELSQQRRQVVEEASQVVAQVQDNYTQQLQTLEEAVNKLAMQELAGVDLNWLAESDPNAYIKYQHRYNQFNQVLQQLGSEAQKIQEQKAKEAQTARAQMLEQGMAELKTRIPNYSNETAQALVKTGTEYGFKQDELADITDPRILHVLNDARQFRELQTAKPQTLKKAAEAPKVIKPGSKPAVKQDNKSQELRERVRKSAGKDEDALTAFIKRTLR